MTRCCRLLAALLLLPVSAFAAGDDFIIPPERFDQTKAVLKGMVESAERAQLEAESRARQRPLTAETMAEDLSEAIAGNEGFRKFVALKKGSFVKGADGKLQVAFGDEPPVTGVKALDALIRNFRKWNRDESTLRPVSCVGVGGSCSSSIWCCGSLMCVGGVCSGGNEPNCIPRGGRCSSSIWCCGTGICNDAGYCQ